MTTRRCGCTSDGDPTVFGPCRACHPKPELAPAQYNGADDWTELRPFEQTLDEDERHDR